MARPKKKARRTGLFMVAGVQVQQRFLDHQPPESGFCLDQQVDQKAQAA
jgi:hypothetical protein